MSEWLDFVESCGLEPTGDIDRVAKRMGWWNDDYRGDIRKNRKVKYFQDVKKDETVRIFSSFQEALEYSRSHNGVAFVRYNNSDKFILKK